METTFTYKLAFALKCTAAFMLLIAEPGAALSLFCAGLTIGWLESPKVETV